MSCENAFPFVVEIAYEIVVKLGGIHTSFATKAPWMARLYGDGYLAVGPDEPGVARRRFDPEEAPAELDDLFARLAGEGIDCRYGRLRLAGSPRAVLIEPERLGRAGDFLDRVRSASGLDLAARPVYEHPVDSRALAFAFAAGRLVAGLADLPELAGRRLVAHVHEYMAGLALPVLERQRPEVARVFTLHATQMGRHHASLHGAWLGGSAESVEDFVARIGRELPVKLHKHLYERACVESAHVVTAVGEGVSREAELLFGRAADVVTPNGLTFAEPPGPPAAGKQASRRRVEELLRRYFEPFHEVAPENARFLYTAGRHEIVVKGYDLFLEALQLLNRRLSGRPSPPAVFAFFFVILWGNRVKPEVRRLLAGEPPETGEGPPRTLITVPRDYRLTSLADTCGLANRASDPVKLLLYPAPVQPRDGLLDLSYEEVLEAMDVGVFPSLYEPWGYTPLESAAAGAVTLTTDAAGFGSFVREMAPQRGVEVLEVAGRARREVVEGLARRLEEIVLLPGEELRRRQGDARRVAREADWERFVERYREAHRRAAAAVSPVSPQIVSPRRPAARLVSKGGG